MSTIHNSYEYYEGNQSLLSMLNKKKTGNKLINQIISDNEAAFKKKMESMGIYSDSSKDKYSNVAKASDSLLDAIEDVTKEVNAITDGFIEFHFVSHRRLWFEVEGVDKRYTLHSANEYDFNTKESASTNPYNKIAAAVIKALKESD